MVNYSKGKIYMIEPICEYDEGDVYIGSTTKKYLSDRMSQHRLDFKSNKVRSSILFNKYGVENCKIVLVENYPCDSKEELIAKEAEYIRKLKCINKVIPDRNRHEYYNDNKEIIKQRTKTWQQENKSKVDTYNKQYYKNNMEQIKEQTDQYRTINKGNINLKQKEKVQCECGCMIVKRAFKLHTESKKHQDLMNAKSSETTS